jgi:hypothetical protein
MNEKIFTKKEKPIDYSKPVKQYKKEAESVKVEERAKKK